MPNLTIYRVSQYRALQNLLVLKSFELEMLKYNRYCVGLSLQRGLSACRLLRLLNSSFLLSPKESPFNLISNMLEAALMIKRSVSGIRVTLQDYSLDGLGDPRARQILVELPVTELKLGIME